MRDGLSMDLRIATQGVQKQTTDRLKAAITSGLFKPGERLIEAELCERLGVSRPSLREAMRSLEAQRLVVIVPNKGPSVPVLSCAEAMEIYDVRAMLEGEVAAACADRATATDVAAMEAALQNFDGAVKSSNLESQIETTREFYDALIACCGNSILRELLDQLLARINVLRRKSMSQTGRPAKSAREMHAILRAIVTGRRDAARDAAMLHVRHAREAAAVVYNDAESNRT